MFHKQTQKLPSKVHKELDTAVRQCVWGSSAEQRKIHLLSWKSCVVQRKRGIETEEVRADEQSYISEDSL